MKIICKTEIKENGLLLLYPSKAVKEQVVHFAESVNKAYNGYMTAELKKPYKSRTTGEGSQNNLFWKLVEIICNENGEEPSVTEYDLKIKAIAKGYPYHISKITGQPSPESTTKINTVEMSYLIDTAYEVIAFLGIVLEPSLSKTPSIPEPKADEKPYDIF